MINHHRNPQRSLCPHWFELRTTAMVMALGLAALLLVFVATPAWAAPSHPFLASFGIGGFDKACGTAVDSTGDVYVSSSGESQVKVYDPEHKLLTSIGDVNEPCGLAVDGKGDVYVSEAKTGNVVRYAPSAYPLSGTPTYGSPVGIDTSGQAKGIAVDPFDEWLYVAEGSRIGVYKPDGSIGIDEAQHILPFEATGGTFKLSFNGQTTGSLPFNASHAEVEAALDGLSTIGAGNVRVSEGEKAWEGLDHVVTFVGALAHTDVEPIDCDDTGLEGAQASCLTSASEAGFSGYVGEGSFTDVTAVAPYTYTVVPGLGNLYDRHVFAADSGTGKVKIFSGPDVRSLSLSDTVDGSQTPDGSIGFGPGGAGLTVDQGNEANGKQCLSVAEQACVAGHFFVYDDLHGVVDEFDATGAYVDQMKLGEADAGFADALPTAIAVDRSGDSHDGTVYVSGGAGLGAEVLAYGPLATPGRAVLPALSRILGKASAVTTDSAGDVYVLADASIHVYDSNGKAITEIEDSQFPKEIDVDSTGKLYVNDYGGSFGKEKITYYTPDVFPPVAGTKYSRHEPAIATTANFEEEGLAGSDIGPFAINPANDHVFVKGEAHKGRVWTVEFDSVAHGSAVLNDDFANGVGYGAGSMAVYGANGDVYYKRNESPAITVMDSSGTRVLARITGVGGPNGTLGGSNASIAVDQSNGHVLAFDPSRGVVEEFDASGAFVTAFGHFDHSFSGYGVAIDNSDTPSRGRVYTAYDDPTPETFDVTAFDVLSYGEPPDVVTGVVSGLDGKGAATLNGTVDPRGFDLQLCRFDYVDDASYQSTGFVGAQQASCVPEPAGIGKGDSPVPVHADVEGLAKARYEFRLVAANKFGVKSGEVGVFGLPVVVAGTASSVGYTEATLRASVDPSGVPTRYRFEYGTSEAYGLSTGTGEVGAGAGSTGIEAPVVGLTDGQTYHFRLVAESDAGTVDGPDGTFTTLVRWPSEECPNAEYRTGQSAGLPDCRAYELVTPAETHGGLVGEEKVNDLGAGFNNWLASPRGPGAGESVSFFVPGSLPGFDGNGELDGYHAERSQGEEGHPVAGWTTKLFGPSYAQNGAGIVKQLGVSADGQYSLWELEPKEAFAGTLPTGRYLRTPVGFELVGQGSLGSDPAARSRYVSPGGTHLLFTSQAQLEPQAPSAGTTAVYDRRAGSSLGQVVSVRPDGSAFGAGENATFVASTEDGSAIVFEVGGVLYVHREGVSVQVANVATFAGISEDGKRVFYAQTSSGESPSSLFVCDVQSGPCAGPEAKSPVQIAPESVFVTVSDDGSHVYFTSKGVLDEKEDGVAGADNLYVWDGARITLVAILDPRDLSGFEGESAIKLDSWTSAIGPGRDMGRANVPARSTPDGGTFVFQSHAQLTSYDNEGDSEVYRYQATGSSGERLSCVSCDPTGAPPSGDATLQNNGIPVTQLTLIANVTDDGQAVFFQSPDRLVPEDANTAQDVYEWRTNGSGSCMQPGGCLALISSGQGEEESALYAMSADGHDVFFSTLDRLVLSDVVGSPSIYDARIDGGIPAPAETAPCQGDACQGQAGQPPVLAAPASVVVGAGNVTGTELGAPKSGGKTRSLTNSQKLARALKACKRKPRRKRHRCEAQAHKRYPVHKATRSTNRRTGR